MSGDEDESFATTAPEDDLSPWRPGSQVQFERRKAQPFTTPSSPEPDDSRAGATRPKGALVAVALVAVLAIGGVVWMAVGSEDPGATVDLADQQAEVGPTAGGGDGAPGVELPTFESDPTAERSSLAAAIGSLCGPARLPDTVGTNWVTEVSDARPLDAGAVVGEAAVAVLFLEGVDRDSPGSPALRAFARTSGRLLWLSSKSEALSSNSRLLGVVDGAVIVAPVVGSSGSDDRIAAYDEGTGELLWSRGFRGRWNTDVHPASDQVFVSLRRPAGSASGVGELSVLDARTGDREHIAPGAFLTVATDGRVISLAGDKLLATSPSARDLIGVVDDREPYALVADPATAGLGVATLSPDGSTVELSGPTVGGFENRRALGREPPRVREPEVITRISTIGGSAAVIAAGGEIFGAAIGEESSLDVAWSVDGSLLRSQPSERGATLLVASEGGASQKVVDAATGTTIVVVPARVGGFSTLGLFANGVVVLDSVDDEPVRSVLDLDGDEMYTIPGSGPLVSGGDSVFDVVQDVGRVRVSGWVDDTADPSPGDPACVGPVRGGGGGAAVR